MIRHTALPNLWIHLLYYYFDKQMVENITSSKLKKKNF